MAGILLVCRRDVGRFAERPAPCHAAMNPSVILCLVASSTIGRSALAQAVALARSYEAELHVLHVDGRRRRGQRAGQPSVRPDVGARLSAMIQAVGTDGVRLTLEIRVGDPVTTVVEYARHISADLVVVASSARPSGMYGGAGAYSRKIARAAPCATLAVPAAASDRPNGSFTHILCPIDFSIASTAAFGHALIIAQRNGGRLTLLHVMDSGPYDTARPGRAAPHLIREHRARGASFARLMRNAVPPDARNSCDVDARVVSGVPHHTILVTASELQADLLVMGVSDRSALHRVLKGSTVAPVLRRATCPVLLVRANAYRDDPVGTGERGAPGGMGCRPSDLSA